MTKRESAKVVATRRKANVIVRALERAAELELSKPHDVAYLILNALDHDAELERKFTALKRHMAADPHCTCNDCIAYHAESVR